MLRQGRGGSLGSEDEDGLELQLDSPMFLRSVVIKVRSRFAGTNYEVIKYDIS